VPDNFAIYAPLGRSPIRLRQSSLQRATNLFASMSIGLQPFSAS
jgi:hypothetical protein